MHRTDGTNFGEPSGKNFFFHGIRSESPGVMGGMTGAVASSPVAMGIDLVVGGDVMEAKESPAIATSRRHAARSSTQ
jgi:hypothetical protein